jgi:hypothetical protein
MTLKRAQIGTNTTLICRGHYFTSLFWWRNDEMIRPEIPKFFRFRITTTNNGSELYIRDVTQEDNGTYVCEFIALRYKALFVDLLVEGKQLKRVLQRFGEVYSCTNIFIADTATRPVTTSPGKIHLAVIRP